MHSEREKEKLLVSEGLEHRLDLQRDHIYLCSPLSVEIGNRLRSQTGSALVIKVTLRK